MRQTETTSKLEGPLVLPLREDTARLLVGLEHEHPVRNETEAVNRCAFLPNSYLYQSQRRFRSRSSASRTGSWRHGRCAPPRCRLMTSLVLGLNTEVSNKSTTCQSVLYRAERAILALRTTGTQVLVQVAKLFGDGKVGAFSSGPRVQQIHRSLNNNKKWGGEGGMEERNEKEGKGWGWVRGSTVRTIAGATPQRCMGVVEALYWTYLPYCRNLCLLFVLVSLVL